jgi:c(7)-type cytochrome triheme protein
MWHWIKSARRWAITIVVLLACSYFLFHTGLFAQAQESEEPHEHEKPHGEETTPLENSAISTEEEELILLDEEHPIAFDYLPKTLLGYVDWVKAITEGVINPKESLSPDYRPMPPIDFDVVFQIEGEMPDVVYPHYPHTIWLDCRNCHPAIFKMQAGSNPVTMEKILRGEFCGRCHGKVAFPISDCKRCHSRPK